MSEYLKYREKLLVALLQVQEQVKDGATIRYGICYNAEEALAPLLEEYRPGEGATEEEEEDFRYLAEDVSENLLPIYFKRWPKYSGHSAYPVPDPEDYHGAVGAFTRLCKERHREAFWEGEYGELRRELLGFIINELKDELS